MFTHIWWHLALFFIDQEDKASLEDLLATTLWGDLRSDFKADYWSCTGILGLLWKVQLRGGAAFEDFETTALLNEALEFALKFTSTSSQLYTVVRLWATCVANNATGTAEILSAMKASVESTIDLARRAELEEVWLPFGDAVVAAYGPQQSYQQALALLAPILDRLHVLGGSSEQREVACEFAMDVLLRQKAKDSLEPMVKARCAQRTIPFLKRLQEQAASLE